MNINEENLEEIEIVLDDEIIYTEGDLMPMAVFDTMYRDRIYA